MTKKPSARKPGRPASSNPKSVLISFRINQEFAEALDKKKLAIGVLSFSPSDTAREIVLRAFKAEGLME